MSSTATVNAWPSVVDAASTSRAKANPNASGSQRAWEKNRCARDQCARPAIPAAAHMPVTVRGSTAPNAPVTSNAKVRKVGAVNTARQAPSTSDRPAGTVADASIDETTRPGCLITRRCFLMSDHDHAPGPRVSSINAALKITPTTAKLQQ